MGLVIWAAKRALSAPTSRRPREENRIRGRSGRRALISRASITPSISGICMSRIATSKGSPRFEPLQRLPGRAAVAAHHAPGPRLQDEDAAIGVVVVHGQEAPAGQVGCWRLNNSWRLTSGRATGSVRMVK